MAAANINSRAGEIIGATKWDWQRYWNTLTHIDTYQGSVFGAYVRPLDYIDGIVAEDTGLTTGQVRNLPTSERNRLRNIVKDKYNLPGGGSSNWALDQFKSYRGTSGFRDTLFAIQKTNGGISAGHGVSFAQVELIKGVVPEWTNGIPSGDARDCDAAVRAMAPWDETRVIEYAKTRRRERNKPIQWAFDSMVKYKSAPYNLSNTSVIKRML